MVSDIMNECSTLKTWSKGSISTCERMNEGMVQTMTKWNQHNVSPYEIWGGWKSRSNYDWKFLWGNVWIKKGRDHEKWNYGEGNQPSKD